MTDPEKLISAARKHFATDFPNPRRAGCPAPPVIQVAARAGQIPGDELRDHLFRCSECFNEYRAVVLDHHRENASPAKAMGAMGWRAKLSEALSKWRLPALVGATALSLIVLGLLNRGPFSWRQRQTAPPQSSQNRPQPTQPAAVEDRPAPVEDRPAATAQTGQPVKTTGSGRENKPEKPQKAELFALSLNLNQYTPLGESSRGASSREEETKIILPSLRARLTLQLRKDSEDGLYQISVVNPESDTLVKTRARSRDGILRVANLDLRRVSQAHRLRIECGDDMNEYLIEIVGP